MGLYDTLKTDIVMGHFPPGSKLKIDMLKQRYGMGVNVIRESLARLASENLIAAENQKGFRVAEISQSRLSDLTRLRILLETDGFKYSIINGGLGWESALVASYHKLEYIEQKMCTDEEQHFKMWNECDWEFHSTLLSACGSHLHRLYHKRVFEQFRQYVISNLKTHGFRGENIIREHEAILNAALDRDFEKGREAIETHLNYYLLNQKPDKVDSGIKQ